MRLITEFLATRAKMNCAWYAIPLSIVFTWRNSNAQHIPFYSIDAAKNYFFYFFFTYLVLMLSFFILFAISKRVG